jgi:inner membrane protein
MDNLTHSLFGAAIAEVYVEKKFKQSAFRPPKNIFYFFSIFANNCPDLDLLFGLIDNSTLGYLLNHRGWTHTIVGTLPQTLLLMGFAWTWLRFVRQDLVAYFKDIVLLIFIGMQAHMLLDFFNSYGVHPWAPFNNSWYYLDSIFIIEPLLWFALMSVWVPLWKWRLLLLIPPIAAYAFGWWSQFVPTAVVLFAVIFASFAFNLQRYLLKVHRGVIGLVLFFAVVFTFWGSQHWARMRILEELGKNNAQKTLDLVLTSLPSNPTCWFFLAPQVSETAYTVIHGSIALYGNSRDCKSWPRKNIEQPSVGEQSALGELWIRQRWQASLKDLQPLLERCDVQGWLQFARVPYWENSILNDLRFSVRGGNNMTTHDLNKWPRPVCPVLHVPWQPPRQDLLELVKTIPR